MTSSDLSMPSRKRLATLYALLLALTFFGSRGSRAQTPGRQQQAATAGVAILIDVSASAQDSKQYGRTREALERFVKGGGAGDVYMVVGVTTEPKLYTAGLVGPDDALKALRKALTGRKEFGATALYDACVLSSVTVGGAGRAGKSVVVFSDGMDTISDATLEEAQGSLRRDGVRLFAVVMERGSLEKKFYEMGASNLERLASATGGAAFRLGKSETPDSALQKIAEAMRK